MLLGEAVGVLAGERADEPRLAVVDVPGGADGQRHQAPGSRAVNAASRGPRHGARHVVDVLGAQRPRVEQQPAVAHDPDHRRVAEPQRRGELLLDRARDARQLRERERAAADTRHGLLDLPADERRQPVRARAHRVDRLVEHAQDGDLAASTLRVVEERERSLERGERELVGPQRPLQRVAAEPLHERRLPDDDAGLRAAEELVAGEADEIGAGGEARGRSRLVAERRAATPEPRSSTSGRPTVRDPRELARGRPLGEPDDAEVRLVDAQDAAVSGPIARS